MPIAIQPDLILAGGFIEGGVRHEVEHGDIPGGNAAGRRRSAVEYIQARLDDIRDLSTVPIEDPDHPDYVQGVNGSDPASNLPVYDDLYNVIDDGTSEGSTIQVTIADPVFIYKKGSTEQLVGRTWVTFVTLVKIGDADLGGNDRYLLGWRRTR